MSRQSLDPAEAGGSRDVRVIDLEIANDVAEIEPVVDAVRRACEMMHFDARHVRLNVPVALTEALSNAILRGNADDPRKLVRVRARVDRKRLIVEVSDEGGGFDLDACTVDPTVPDRLEREEGRGLFLMQKLMDRVERFAVGHLNVVRLTLHRL